MTTEMTPESAERAALYRLLMHRERRDELRRELATLLPKAQECLIALDDSGEPEPVGAVAMELEGLASLVRSVLDTAQAWSNQLNEIVDDPEGVPAAVYGDVHEICCGIPAPRGSYVPGVCPHGVELLMVNPTW